MDRAGRFGRRLREGVFRLAAALTGPVDGTERLEGAEDDAENDQNPVPWHGIIPFKAARAKSLTAAFAFIVPEEGTGLNRKTKKRREGILKKEKKGRQRKDRRRKFLH